MAERHTDNNKLTLAIRDLQVYYGESHAIQGVELTLDHGILSVVGRNGMGKTTLCNAIMGLTPSRSGSIRYHGKELRNRTPNVIANMGIGYVPQGRRIWPSLTVDEHLRLVVNSNDEASWTIERIYDTFPRLAERRSNGGSQLSGGEQQMLAISRALLRNPRLLIMDEPTEGLAPVIVQQVQSILLDIARDREFSILLIEQNIGVATTVSEKVAIMVNGRINRVMDAQELAADRALQQQLLGVGRQDAEARALPTATDQGSAEQMRRTDQPETDATASGASTVHYHHAPRSSSQASQASAANHHLRPLLSNVPNRWGTPNTATPASANTSTIRPAPEALSKPIRLSIAEQMGKTAIVAGTFDTKSTELAFIRDQLRRLGITTRTVDLSTSRQNSRTDVTPNEIASCHPRGSAGVFTGDRGSAVTAMSEAFTVWISRQRDIGGVISAGGSGGTSLVAPALRSLPVGMPKLIISTVASSDVGPYVGASDITMMYSVTDVQGINAISRDILRNGASALAGMINAAPTAQQRQADLAAANPAVGITMFGVTTLCVQAVVKRLEASLDCVVFHATGTGGRAMEKLVDAGQLGAVLDLTTTELADMHVGGVFPADQDRMGAIIRTKIPYVGSVGALDMVNFASRNTVPAQFSQRNLHVHNSNVTLMRTSVEENRWIGQWLGERLNQMTGPVRFLLPEGGVSILDAPGQPFYDPAANAALFDAIESTFKAAGNRKLIRVAANLNDPAFVEQAVQSLAEIYKPPLSTRSA